MVVWSGGDHFDVCLLGNDDDDLGFCLLGGGDDVGVCLLGDGEEFGGN